MNRNWGIILKLFFVAAISLCLCTPFPINSSARSKREHLVYFPDTAYELNVYKISGEKSGKTLMLIGGIQGNEPGGFLSADLYADMSLAKGNLIVVPRANFYSILLNHRGPHGDMNRKFTREDMTNSMEDKIVNILKKLIAESDFLLNLHDGSGYYYPKYINKWRGPMRFGQSIIADYDEYLVPGTTKTIRLGDMAREVIDKVNEHIKNELYKFHFKNTKTDNPKSLHKEQRKSATYYSLTKHHIPAFGVETSKFLPAIDLKVRYHNLVINEFMRLFGIVPEHPSFAINPPVLKYLVVSVNSQVPIVIKNKQPLVIQRRDSIHVSHIEANYERGLSLDILGYGGLNDFRKDFVIAKNTSLVVRKDNQKFAEIPIKISKKLDSHKARIQRVAEVKYLIVRAKGHRILLTKGETLHLTKGDHLKIEEVFPSSQNQSSIKVNFKGFVGDWKNNTGEDRGYEINTDTDLLKRYSLNKKGETYEIVVSQDESVLSRFYVYLAPPRMDYMVQGINGNSQKLN